jgi:hypothetical protein
MEGATFLPLAPQPIPRQTRSISWVERWTARGGVAGLAA